MSKFVLGVDIDGVLGDYTEAFRTFVSLRKGVPAWTMCQPETWEIHEEPSWPIESREEFLELHNAAVRNGIFAAMHPIPYAAIVLQALEREDVHISIVTSRFSERSEHRRVVHDTADFLDRHQIPYHDILFLKDKERYRFDVIVEDMPSNIMKIRDSERTGDVIIYDQLYNRGVTGCRRAYSWLDINYMVSLDLDAWRQGSLQSV